MERQEVQAEQQELGHYQFRRLLGEGGFGQVYEAWDPKLQRSIAIKRLKPQVLSSRPENLLDEARLAASLRHPAFVKIFSIDGDAEQQSIIMEYVDGSTLRQLLQGQPMPEAKVLDIICQVAEAMQEAHEAKLIHGDIKPSNLMLDAAGTVRIMDFGLARKIDPEATESVVFGETQGTIAYLAPELLMGKQPSAQSDIYALGVVMYEMLTGGRPFAHLSGLALAAAHIQSSSDLWVFPPETNPTVAALVRAMTARDVAQRLASMLALRDAAVIISDPTGRTRPAASADASHERTGYLPVRLFAALRKRRVIFFAGCAILFALGMGFVLKSTEWGFPVAPVFSEASAMKKGMEALRSFGPDETIEIAIQNFTAVLERRPDHAAAAAGLSMAYSLRHAGNSRDNTWLQRADASAQLALKLNDQLALAYAAMASVRFGQSKFDEALQLDDKALRLDPMDLFALNHRAIVLIRMRRIDEAALAVAAGMKIYPNERVFVDTLGHLHFDQGDYKAAEKAFRRSIQLNPDAVAAYGNLNAALVRQNRVDEALQVLQQGLQVRPSGYLYNNLGDALFTRGDYVAAAEAFEHAVSPAMGGANDYLRWANLADTLRWIPGRAEASLRAYQQAVKLLKPLLDRSPNDSTLTSQMGLYLARLGDKAKAAELITRAVIGAPNSAHVHFRAAMAFELIGDRPRALIELENAQMRGYPPNLISVEPDLIALRRDPRYSKHLSERAK